MNVEKIEDFVFCSSLVDEKFKFNVIAISFIVDLEEKKAAENAILASFLRQSCKKYPSNLELGRKLRSLYGADLFCDIKKAGGKQVIVFGIKVLDDEFAIEREELTKKAIELLVEIVFEPKIVDGGFLEKDVDIQKQELIKTVLSLYGDKRHLAFEGALKTLFGKKSFAINKYGSLNALKEVTAKDLFKSHSKLLSDSTVFVSCCSRKDQTENLKIIFDRFSGLKRNGNVLLKDAQYVLEGLKEEEKQDDLLQAKLVVGFAKTRNFEETFEQELAIELMNSLFGGTATSLLFTNVREKLSLCYYCRSVYDSFSGVIFVESAVEGKNIEKAQKAIVLQLEAIKKGEFEEQELEKVKSTLESFYEKITDSEGKTVSYFLSRFLKGEKLMPVERIAKIKNITKEQIIKAAEKFSLALKYVLKSKD